MARRYMAEHSPGAKGAGAARGAPPAGAPPGGRWRYRRGTLLFLAPLPLAFQAFGRDPRGLVLSIAALAMFLLGAWLTREGQIAHAAYDARRIARRPAFPRKIFAALLIGAGIFTSIQLRNGGALNGALLAALAVALHLFAFRPDPLHDKHAEGIDRFQQDRVARVSDEAAALLEQIRSEIARLNERALSARVSGFSEEVRRMIETVESDPRDLSAARRYLGVYLQGARDATARFVDLYAAGKSPEIRKQYEDFLDDLQKNYAARTRHLMENGREDMEVEIEVLRERLQREGLAGARPGGASGASDD